MHVSTFVHEHVPAVSRGDIRFPGAGFPGDYEPPDVGAENKTPVIGKNSKCS